MDFSELKGNLIKRGYKVSAFDTKEAAADYIAGQLHGQKIGFGGSLTLEEMGLYDKLSADNNVVWHWRVPDGKTAKEVRDDARDAEVYISSVNGMSRQGEIINIDGTGNRVAETLYGHKKVIFVVGRNKVAGDYDIALFRARNQAAPMNAKRLGKKTPCAVKGDKCYDCDSPDRICRGLVVLWEAPSGCEYQVVLVDEKLGL